MNSSRSTQKITDKVEPQNIQLEHNDIKEYFNQWSVKLHAVSIDYAENLKSNSTLIIKEQASPHGLASAIIHAYTLHQHLRLSPDDIWLTIVQGVSTHINKNAEHFRSLFVDHRGKKDVDVDARDIIGYVNGNIFGDWPQVITRFSDTIDKQVKKEGLKQLFECDFSTTSNSSLTASRIILLDAMKKYFRYKLRGGCGIPKVTLDGTLEDWLHIQEKLTEIRNLGLNIDFWFNRLEPVIAQFIETYKGNVDENFWNMVITQVPQIGPSDGEVIGTLPAWDGWISAFFPYSESGFDMPRSIKPFDIPSGLVYVPVELKILDDNFKINVAAGFLGARQDKIDDEYIVSPVIGWYISEGR
ncbi:22217_t:CDS:1 [Gigaspora margarita]|uniref:22217_t:CDS:1 n=1 Tax=Gigaspora margarita TaxID=4874 RepID=A0ABM8W5E8_GIGMA|nr:22217_t:CDS:1 [Gigaspora margarita]